MYKRMRDVVVEKGGLRGKGTKGARLRLVVQHSLHAAPALLQHFVIRLRLRSNRSAETLTDLTVPQNLSA